MNVLESNLKTLEVLEIIDFGFETMTPEIFNTKNEGSVAVFQLTKKPDSDPDLSFNTGDQYWVTEEGLYRLANRWSGDFDQSTIGQSYWAIAVQGLPEWYPGYEDWLMFGEEVSSVQVCGFSAWKNIFLLKNYFPGDLTQYPIDTVIPSLTFVMFKTMFTSGIEFVERKENSASDKMIRDIVMHSRRNHIVAKYGMKTLKLKPDSTFSTSFEKT